MSVFIKPMDASTLRKSAVIGALDVPI